MPTIMTRIAALLVTFGALLACSDDSDPSSAETGDAGATTASDAGSTADIAPTDTDSAGEDTTDLVDTGPEETFEVCPPLDCEAFISECEGPDCPIMSNYARVVPSGGIPDAAETQLANNNLDVVRHEGRVYLSFRTAPYHFADSAATIHVVSSEDERVWSYEASYNVGKDVREPRFLSWDGRLFVYFAVLGTNPIAFEPEGMMVSEQRAPGEWTEAEWFHEPGFIPWRTKVVDGVPYMIAYEGGENIYELDGKPITVHWLTTTDGVNWTPAVPDQPVVLTGGSSETDFVLLDDGALIAVSRNEAGDLEFGWGSKLCRAEPGNLGDWSCISDPRKYDSPLLFEHDGGVYLLGRRNVTESGHYDLGGDDLSPADRTSRNLLSYSNQPKRCSLWEVDPNDLSVTLLFDLPSRGDTCFPGIVQLDDSSYSVYNYTSPFDTEDDPSWLEGQADHTLIYRLTLTFP